MHVATLVLDRVVLIAAAAKLKQLLCLSMVE